MRAWMATAVAVALIGCGGGKDEDSGNTESCEDRVLTPLGDIPNEEWPEGLDASIEAYKALGGTWEGENCANDEFIVSVKVVTAEIGDIEVITSGVSSTTPCGCLNDPEFSHDSAYNLVAIAPDLEVSLEMKDEEVMDPGLDNRTFTLSGGMYGADQTLLYRACSSEFIDPVYESAFDQVAVIFRLETNDAGTLQAAKGIPSLTFFLDTLTDGGAENQCDLTSLVKTVDEGQ